MVDIFQPAVSPPGLSEEAARSDSASSGVNGDRTAIPRDSNGNGTGKPRRKVSRACDSCRKKKIKCSGTLPCKSCETYGCECVYSHAPYGVAKGKKKTAKSDSSAFTKEKLSVQSIPNSTVAILNPEIDGNSYAPSRTGFSEATITGVQSHLHSSRSSFGRDSSSGPSATGSMSVTQTSHPVGFSCPRRFDPVKDDASTNINDPSSDDINRYPILYISNAEIESRIAKLKECVSSLRRNDGPQSESIMYAIKNIEFEIQTLNNKLARPCINHELTSNPELNRDKSVCFEAKLMKNHESNYVSLNRYVKINTNKLEEYLQKPPMVDVKHGLYFPGQWLSLRGVGYFVKDFMKHAKCNIKELKENIYLILRQFDIMSAVEIKNAECWGAPVELYCQNFSVKVRKDERVQHLLRKIPASLLNKVIATKSEFKLENWNHIINNTSETSVSSATDAFHWIIAIMEVNKNEYQKLSKHHKLSAQQRGDDIITETLFFIEAEELLFTLGLHFFKQISIARVHSEPLTFLDDLLDFVMNIFWIDGHQIFTCLLSSAIQTMRLCGMDHWETYLVMDERMADSRRNLWWKAFIWDQYSVFITGSRPVFSTVDIQGPLFPGFMRKMKFIDHQDLMANFDEQFNLENVDFSSSDLTRRETIAFVIFLSCFFAHQFQCKIVFSDRFSNFRIFALSKSEKIKMAEEVLSELRIYKHRLDILNEGFKRYLESGLKKVDPKENSDLEDPGIFWYEITREVSLTFCVVSSVHIIARLNPSPEVVSISQEMKKFRKNIGVSWKSTMQYLEQNNSLYDLFFMSKLVALVAVSYVGENIAYFKHASFDDVCSFVKICRFFDYSGINCGSVENTRIQRTLLQIQFLLKILVRCVVSVHVQSHKKTIENLLQQLASSKYPEYQETIVKLFDPTFNYFSPTLNALKESELHLQIKSWLTETLYGSVLSLPNNLFFDDIFPTYTPSAGSSVADQRDIPPNYFTEAVDTVNGTVIANKNPHFSSTERYNGNNELKNGLDSSDKTEGFQNPVSSASPSKLSEPSNHIDQGTTFNLGTIYDFADHGDFDRLFSFIWDDFVGAPVSSTEKE